MCYAEQTSHHPPISNIFIVNPKFKLYGYTSIELITGANEMTLNIKGSFTLVYNDGAKYKYKFPKPFISGIMVGSRYFNFKECLAIEDEVRTYIICFFTLK